MVGSRGEEVGSERGKIWGIYGECVCVWGGCAGCRWDILYFDGLVFIFTAVFLSRGGAVLKSSILG